MNEVKFRKRSRGLLALMVAVMLVAGPTHAQNSEPAFMKNLFSPELVMQNQRAIGLSGKQRKAMTRVIQKTQSDTLEWQWAMQDAVQRLEDEISKDPIDEAAAISIAKQMMETEGKVKRAHLSLLIQLRNLLDPEQRNRLRKLRDRAN